MAIRAHVVPVLLRAGPVQFVLVRDVFAGVEVKPSLAALGRRFVDDFWNTGQTWLEACRRATDLLIIGEAPGADEDRLGEPFVGRAGQLLDQMLLAIGESRDSVFIANILKCRPPDNRDPRLEEVLQCEPFLRRQLALVQPKVILAVGRVAAQSLLKSQDPVGRMRGRDYRFADTPLLVTYHPAYLLRRPQEKAKSWQDLQFAWRLLNDG